jgi:N-glycosylase/DNA lyase
MTERLTAIESLAKEVLLLQGDPYVRSMVENRIAEFIEFQEKDSYAWFEELAYCLLTAYSSAERGQLCVEALCVDDLLIDGDQDMIAKILRSRGHRFADRRAEYIVEARFLAPNLKSIIQGFKTLKEARNWLVANVKGLGWKEASHFLRNIGYMDVAIIDRHILSNMKEHGLIPDNDRRTLTRSCYLEYERLLKKVAERVNMTLGELDLYLWYRKTGKVLK